MTEQLKQAAQAALNACERIVDQEDSPVQFGIDFRALGSSLRRALTQRPAAQTEREAPRWTVSVEPVAVSGEPDAHCLRASIGNQAFHIGPDYMETKQEAEFFAEMFLHAIEVGHRASLPAPQQATPGSACKVCQGTGDTPLVTKGESLCKACYGTGETLTQATPPKVVVMSDSAEGNGGSARAEGRNLTPEEIAQVTGYTIPTPDDSFTAITYQTNDIGFFVDATEAARKQKELFFVNGFHDSVFGQSTPGWSYTQARRVDENTVDIGRVVAFADEGATSEPVPADQAKWCEYVAGMVDCWVSAEWSNYHHKDEDLRVKAIAGIIERRLWALNKQRATPPQQAAGEPVGEPHTVAAQTFEAMRASGASENYAVRRALDVAVAEWVKRAKADGLIADTRTAPGVPEGFALVPMTEDQVWHNDSIMSANAIGGLKMDAVMRIVRGVEAHHSERLAAAQAKGGEHG